MPVSERAKQFMPFSALKGLNEALARKEKEIIPKAELSEERTAELNGMLVGLKKSMVVTVKYFSINEYLVISGKVTLLDDVNRMLRVEDTKIPFDDIYDIMLAHPKGTYARKGF